jgi:hypothetical protein
LRRVKAFLSIVTGVAAIRAEIPGKTSSLWPGFVAFSPRLNSSIRAGSGRFGGFLARLSANGWGFAGCSGCNRRAVRAT